MFCSCSFERCEYTRLMVALLIMLMIFTPDSAPVSTLIRYVRGPFCHRCHLPLHPLPLLLLLLSPPQCLTQLTHLLLLQSLALSASPAHPHRPCWYLTSLVDHRLCQFSLVTLDFAFLPQTRSFVPTCCLTGSSHNKCETNKPMLGYIHNKINSHMTAAQTLPGQDVFQDQLNFYKS